jgi:hypothetical protein
VWALVAAGAVSLGALVLPVGRVQPVGQATATGTGTAALTRLERLPMQAQGVISTTLGASDDAFAPARFASG